MADGLVGASAAPHGSFVYSAAAVPSVIVAEAYMTANPWNFGASSFHHWPFGDATASCGYDPQNYSCSTASGTGEKLYTLTLANPKTAFLLTHSGCDNGEESRVEVDGSVWATAAAPISVRVSKPASPRPSTSGRSARGRRVMPASGMPPSPTTCP